MNKDISCNMYKYHIYDTGREKDVQDAVVLHVVGRQQLVVGGPARDGLPMVLRRRGVPEIYIYIYLGTEYSVEA